MLGYRRLALNFLVRDVIVAQLGWPKLDFNQVGRGTHAAVDSLINAIHGDRPWIWTADIKNFFPSIGRDGIKETVRVPEEVRDNVIFISDNAPLCVASGFGSIESHRKALQAGLPPGTPTSQIVSAFELERAIYPVAFDRFCATYADNLFGAAEYESVASAALENVRALLLERPAGALHLHDERVTYADHGPRLLGYMVTTIHNQDAYDARAFPSPRSRNRWLERLPSLVDALPAHERCERAFELTDSWLRSHFPLSNPSSAWWEAMMDRVIATIDSKAAA